MSPKADEPGLIDNWAALRGRRPRGHRQRCGAWCSIISPTIMPRPSRRWTVNPEGGVARTADGVVVTSKELVMQVFLNADGNYTVDGYQARMTKSIGPIYLGMDWGPEYEQTVDQGQRCDRNASPGRRPSISRCKETRAALAALPDPAAFDIQEISDTVLAAVCKHWFDVPDGDFVQAGRVRAVERCCRRRVCPADYTYPSAYIFHPDPDLLLTSLGERTGQMLREAVGKSR